MYKKVSTILASALLLAGCSTASSAEAKFTAGTYTATAAGRNGDVTLTVKVSDTKIEEVTAEHQETEGIGDVAIDSLIQETIDEQAIPADTVSGATLSSTAYLTAIADALQQAGADTASLQGEKTTEAASYQTEADLIVVGAGGAGLTAALTASQAGASVILLEKSGSVGGNTLATSAGINVADSKVQLADEQYQAKNASVEGMIEVQSQNDHVHANLVKAYAENSGELLDWISDMGAEFEVSINEDPRNAVQNNYMVKAKEGSTAALLVQSVKKTLEESDVVLYTNVDATSLETDENNVVTGVVATDANGQEITFHGKAVILATGGFGQNQELVGEVNPDLAKAITDEIAPTTGEGLIMAQAVGAKTVDLGEIQTFPSVIEGSGMFMSFGLYGSGEFVVVDNDGKRFAEEKFEMGKDILKTEDGLVYGVFDQDNYNESYEAMISNGFMFKADSIADLAKQMDVDAEELQKTIDTWNNDAETTGTDSVFGRENIQTIDGDTYYGYRFGVGAHFFMGGILINEEAQVLDQNENPIEGLYAAGEVTGGFHGTQRVDGSGVGESFVFGRIAGKQAAQAVSK